MEKNSLLEAINGIFVQLTCYPCLYIVEKKHNQFYQLVKLFMLMPNKTDRRGFWIFELYMQFEIYFSHCANEAVKYAIVILVKILIPT